MTRSIGPAMPEGIVHTTSSTFLQRSRQTRAVVLLPMAFACSASWGQASTTLDTVTVRSSGDSALERPLATGSRLDLSARDIRPPVSK